MRPSVTFAVDDVVPARSPLPECGLSASLASRLQEPVLGASHAGAHFVEPLDTHPLVAAVHLAFSQHRPLVLSPDILWVTLSQGLALHIPRNAEALRFDLVRHQGKQRLAVTRTEVDFSSPAFWSGVVDDFAAQLHEKSSALQELMVCDFSTTGTVERVVSQVVLMDALREYFDYVLECICGIPTVTLEGLPADWSRLREKVAQLSRYGLDWWVQHLLPLCDQFIRASQGHPDRAFWGSIYKLREAYGGDVINGWVCKLFPFVRNDVTGHYDRRNPVFESAREADEDDGAMFPPGWIESKVLPTGLSRVPLLLQSQGAGGAKQARLALTAGFVGVSQVSGTRALRPELGWVVHEDRGLEAMLRRLGEEHEAAPPLSQDRLSRWRDWWEDCGLPADVIRLYSACDGASLFGQQGTPTYRLRPAEALEFWDGTGWRRATAKAARSPGGWTRFCDLRDGGFLAFLFNDGDRQRLPILWVRSANGRHGEPVANSLGEFLLRALDSQGHPYFQESGFTPGARVQF